MLRLATLTTASLSFVLGLSACGEHPCTLSVGHPQFCTTLPDEPKPFCREVCDVCETQSQRWWPSACEAHCRQQVGVPDLTCEQLTQDVEAKYRECIETSDWPGCGGNPRG